MHLSSFESFLFPFCHYKYRDISRFKSHQLGCGDLSLYFFLWNLLSFGSEVRNLAGWVVMENQPPVRAPRFRFPQAQPPRPPPPRPQPQFQPRLPQRPPTRLPFQPTLRPIAVAPPQAPAAAPLQPQPRPPAPAAVAPPQPQPRPPAPAAAAPLQLQPQPPAPPAAAPPRPVPLQQPETPPAPQPRPQQQQPLDEVPQPQQPQPAPSSTAVTMQMETQTAKTSPSPTPKAPSRETPPQSPKIIKTSSSTLSSPTTKVSPPPPPPPPLLLPPSQLKPDPEPEAPKTMVIQEVKRTPEPPPGPAQKSEFSTTTRPTAADSEVVRVIALVGENKGAYMELGSPSLLNNKKKMEMGAPHYLQEENAKGNGSKDGQNKEEHGANLKKAPMSAFVNSNVQSVNNSIILNSSYTHHDPGVHLALSRKPRLINGSGLKDHKNGHHI